MSDKENKLLKYGLIAAAGTGLYFLRRKRKAVQYSRIDEIPVGRADSSKITKGCLVVEGGSLRGMYAGGVLDAYMKNDINFDTVIGTSAGALFGYMYVAGQIGRGARFNLRNRFNSEYVGLRAMLENGSPFGFKYAFDNNNTPDEPLDREAFEESPQKLIAVATDCETGKPAYLEKGTGVDMLSAVRASATLPLVSTMAVVEGKKYLDGGCTEAIPVEWAINQGYEKIIVVRTRERTFRKDPDMKATEARLLSQRYAEYPDLLHDLLTSDKEYNKTCDRLIELEKDKRVMVIAPSISPRIDSMEANLEKLGRLYWLGYHDGERSIDRLKKYLDS